MQESYKVLFFVLAAAAATVVTADFSPDPATALSAEELLVLKGAGCNNTKSFEDDCGCSNSTCDIDGATGCAQTSSAKITRCGEGSGYNCSETSTGSECGQIYTGSQDFWGNCSCPGNPTNCGGTQYTTTSARCGG
jgi:hypothetical protein